MHRLIRANPLTGARSRRFRSHMAHPHGASGHRPLRRSAFFRQRDEAVAVLPRIDIGFATFFFFNNRPCGEQPWTSMSDWTWHGKRHRSPVALSRDRFWRLPRDWAAKGHWCAPAARGGCRARGLQERAVHAFLCLLAADGPPAATREPKRVAPHGLVRLRLCANMDLRRAAKYAAKYGDGIWYKQKGAIGFMLGPFASFRGRRRRRRLEG